jgi:antitoxin component YwqK of YwqJK toxin-antitoxin module
LLKPKGIHDANQTFILENQPRETTREEFIKQSERIHQEISSGACEKVVLSRVKSAPYQNQFLIEDFETLCAIYPNAFVYLVSSMHFGTWIGATPEILFEKSGDAYRTVALAATKKVDDSTEWSSKEFFEQGVVNGLYESFFPDGKMQQSLVFVDGLEGGPLKQFYADGTLALSCSFNKGLLDGDWEKFSPTGQLESRGGYSKGERDGAWKELYPEVNGFFWEGKYEKDKKEGIWQVLDSADFVHQEETYLLGSLAAISEFKTRSGLVLDAGRLEKGDGKRYFFDQKGNRLEKGRYANGQRTGIWYTYFPNTNLVASSGGYVANKKRGNWKYYDINSQLVSEEIIPAGGETESIDRSVSTSSSPQGRTRSYMPQQNSKGVVVPQFRILTPDGGVGITGPGMFQLGN